jgi:hypothetical protein
MWRSIIIFLNELKVLQFGLVFFLALSIAHNCLKTARCKSLLTVKGQRHKSF